MNMYSQSYKSLGKKFCASLFIIITILPCKVLAAQPLHNEVISQIDVLLYGWFGDQSQGTTNTASLKEVLGKIHKNKKEQTSYTLGQIYIALLDYNLTEYESLISSLQIDSLYRDRAQILYAIITANPAFSISGYNSKNSLFKDIDYLLMGNYYLQRGNYIKAQEWFVQGLKQSIGLRTSFDILLGVVDTAQKGARFLFVDQKSKTIPFICLLPYVRPIDIYYFLSTENVPADYTLTLIPLDKFSVDTVQSNLSEKKITLSYSRTSDYCTMVDIINCFTSIMLISGKTLPEATPSVSYLPEYAQPTASFLIEHSIIPLYLDGKIPLYSPITGAYFKQLYFAYTTKFGKLSASMQSFHYNHVLIHNDVYSCFYDSLQLLKH